MNTFPTFTRCFVLAASLVAMVLIAACSSPVANTGPVTSSLSSEQATAIAENALQGYNAGDYAQYGRDWDATMTAGITASDFAAWQDSSMQSYGKFVSITKSDLVAAKTPGYVKWVFTCKFENGEARYSLVFKPDGRLIFGATLEPIQ